MCVGGKFQTGFKEGLKVSKKFQKSFRAVLQFCWCMDLIAATRAEGGLVLVQKLTFRISFLI